MEELAKEKSQQKTDEDELAGATGKQKVYNKYSYLSPSMYNYLHRLTDPQDQESITGGSQGRG